MMGYDPENSEAAVANTDEEKNQAVREKFQKMKLTDEQKAELTKLSEELQSRHVDGSKPKYSAKDTENMLQKADQINKSKKYTAHKMDFTKPIETTDLEGIQIINLDQAIELDTECMNCHMMGKTRMCTCSIPYFKEIIVIAFTCEYCLHRETEVKTGGGIPEKGRVYTINVKTIDDLNRDLFKSETAEIEIPEIGCVVVSGSLGGILSTVEGVLEKVF